ncbi:MAG TPA: ABC transporter permease [Candidatus Mcinerneyibacteriales bacterium]|nr:ABC transporter permease [Candidatus Mcinerneyibacteriales bacterium]HPE20763.1 ABC transporter permease [Candidatus Mcinerneyibacteriales bacterium]HPQ88802.1 ABC transporter permease [Candidatus Mcinerneyibacteriales bacterium]
MTRLFAFIRKEFLQFKRDPKMLAMSILSPLLQLILLGYAASFDISHIPTVVWDRDGSAMSRSYIDDFQASDAFKVLSPLQSREELVRRLDTGEAALALIIEEGFQSHMLAGESPKVAALVDGTDTNTATSGLFYSGEVTKSFVQRSRKPQLASLMTHKAGRVVPRMRVTFNQSLESRHFLVPGILGLVLMIITMTLTSLAIVKEKEKGTLEQVMVTPVKGWEVILGKLIPFAVIGMIDILLVIGAAVFLFGIPLKGSLALLLALSFLYLLSMLGLGLFISTISQTQQQAMLTAVFFIITPMVFLSGFIFPVHNMPEGIQLVTPLLPLKHYLEIIRGIFLRGAGIRQLWAPVSALAVLSLGIFSVSLLRFRKSTE